MDNVTQVVAALIVRESNGKKEFMICQRPKNKKRALLWEFVGGKVEKGESKAEALIRECHEELDIAVEVGDVFRETYHDYGDINIHLTLFRCSIVDGKPKLFEHNDLKWISPVDIKNFAFCPADKDILKKISNELA
jgi:8-oxo-dGTP diphosphatase